MNNPGQFAHAIWFNGMGTATINQLHCESAATCLDINDVQTLTINGISGNRIGNPTSQDVSDNYLIRALNLNIDSLTFSAAYYDQSGSAYSGPYPNSRIFGLARGLTSNDIYETPVGIQTWPLYTWGRIDQAHTGPAFLGERSIVANELWLQRIGNYSPNRIAIWDNNGGPNGSYAFFERDGNQLNLGFSPGPWDANEQKILQLNYWGMNNPANNVQVNGRLQTGQTGNTDINGELDLSSATSAGYAFTGMFNIHPQCSATPNFDIGTGNRFWISYAGASSMSVNFAYPVTGSVTYVCFGRN
ncbi:MAG: hypothetical protein M3Y72_05105 [Acidobacteriota bacterium]|nr:hypothetical protein [Acidobacteriota bacterium]